MNDEDNKHTKNKRSTTGSIPNRQKHNYVSIDLDESETSTSSTSTCSTSSKKNTRNSNDFEEESKITVKNYNSNDIVIAFDDHDHDPFSFSEKSNKTQQERGEELEQAEAYREEMLKFSDMALDFEHPLQKAILTSLEKDGNAFSKSSILGYYKYGDPQRNWDAPSLFFKELDRGFFIRPICKKTRFMQMVLGGIGLSVPFAWSPLVLYLSQKYLTFIPVGGKNALSLFVSIYCMSGPPCIAQGWNFGREIGDVIFDANGFTAKLTDEDKKPHMQPRQFPILSRGFSAFGAFQRTLPYPLLYWRAESSHQFGAAFFIYQFSGSIFKRAYDDSMNFWDRLSQNRRDPLIAFEIKSLIKSLTANKELINKGDSDDLVKLLYMSMIKEIKFIEKENRDKKEFHKKLNNLLPEKYELIQTKLSEEITAYVQKMMGTSHVSKSSQNEIFTEIEKKIKQSQEKLNQKGNDDEESYDCRCCKISVPGMVKNYSQKKARKGEYLDLFKKIDDYIEKTIRKLKIDVAIKEKEELCGQLKQDLLHYFSNKINENFGLPSMFYGTISKYVNTKKEAQSQDSNDMSPLEKRIKGLIAESFTQILTTEITSAIEKRTKEKPKQILTAKLCKQFKLTIEQQKKDDLSQRLVKDQELITLIANYLKTALYTNSEVIEDLNKLAQEIKKEAENKFLYEKNRDPLIDNVYICIQKELGNVILKNGLAVHQEDVAMSAFSMLLRKLEMPNVKSIQDDHKELISLLEEETHKNVQQEKHTEKSSLLEEKEKKKRSKAREIVESINPAKSLAFMDILANLTPSFAKTFLHNLSIFDQGTAMHGRWIMATWAANTLLQTSFGMSPEVILALSLTYGGIDALLRPIQEWYLQKDTYASVREIFSTLNIDLPKRSASVNIDYWPFRALANAASGVASCFFSLPTLAIIAEMMPTTDLWIKALIISATARGDIVSCCHFFREQWDDIIRGGAEMAMSFYETDITIGGCQLKSPWDVTVSQMRAWLNDKFDRAISLVPELHDYTIKELHANTQGTH